MPRYRALAALSSAFLMALPAQADTAADEAALRELKTNTWPSIYAANDADALEAFLADDFVLIAGGSARPKTEEVEWMRNNDWEAPDDFRYEVEDVVFLSADTAIIYGRGLSTRETEAGEPCNHSYWSSNTVRREGDAWRPVSSHVSDASCAPIDN